MKIFLSATILLCIWASGVAHAAECQTIERLPYSIENPGCYRLAADFEFKESSGEGITVASNDVVLDLNGKEIRGPHDAANTATAIYGNGVRNVEITNGAVSGFLFGIRIDGGDAGATSRNVTIRNVTARDNYFRGILVSAAHSTITANMVTNTGHTTVFPDAFALGIEVFGAA